MRQPLDPMGCPSAIAPPFTFTRAGSSSSPRMQAIACAANASFSSTRSRSPTRQPARASAFLPAGIGPFAHQVGLDAGGRERHDARERLELRRAHERLARDEHRARAVVQRRAVPRRDRAPFAEHGRELRERLERRVGAGRLVGRERYGVALLLRHGNRARSRARTRPRAIAAAAFFCDATAKRPALRGRSSTSRRRSPPSRPSIGAGSAPPSRGSRSASRASCRRSPAASGRTPPALLRIANGARVMLSTPPATTTSASPVHTRLTASVTASSPEPQSRFTVTAGTSYGSPASSPAMRATLRLSSPAWFVAPKTTWSIWLASPGHRVAIALTISAARSSGRTDASAPLYLAIGVRTASTR